MLKKITPATVIYHELVRGAFRRQLVAADAQVIGQMPTPKISLRKWH